MPNGFTDRLRRLLSGLLVLVVLAMSVAQVNAMISPEDDEVSYEITAQHPHDHHAAAIPAHDHANRPCEGPDRPHGPACCLSRGCPLLAAGLLSTAPVPLPTPPGRAVHARHVSSQPIGVGKAPDLRPPRTTV